MVTNGAIFQKSIQYVAYADDIDIVGRQVEEVKKSFAQSEKNTKEISLPINITNQGSEIETVEKFVYLGSR